MPEIECQLVLEQVVGVVGPDVDGGGPGGAVDGKIAAQVILGCDGFNFGSEVTLVLT